MDLSASLDISASGLKAESARLKVIAENLANADSAAANGNEPYRRQIVSFKEQLDRATGTPEVEVASVTKDKSDFEKRYEPGNPQADKDGYVLMPNVNPLIEAMDMREAQRSYEANLGSFQIARTMLNDTLNLLKG